MDKANSYANTTVLTNAKTYADEKDALAAAAANAYTDAEILELANNINTLLSPMQSRIDQIYGDMYSNATAGTTGIKDRVTTLENAVGDGTSGMAKDVSDLKTAVGSASSGLTKSVSELQNTVGDASSGLVKKVDDIELAISGRAIPEKVDDSSTGVEILGAYVQGATVPMSLGDIYINGNQYASKSTGYYGTSYPTYGYFRLHPGDEVCFISNFPSPILVSDGESITENASGCRFLKFVIPKWVKQSEIDNAITSSAYTFIRVIKTTSGTTVDMSASFSRICEVHFN